MRHQFHTVLLALTLPIFAIAGCMHITMDVNANVNVNVKLDKALNDFFNDLDKNDTSMATTATPAASAATTTAPATEPTTPPPGLTAQEMELRARMKQRQPQIDQFKESGALGENNQGYLEVRSNQDGAAELAAAANADRKTIYQRIAAKQNVSADEVAKTRAQQIAQKSAPGVWIQDARGNWTKK